MKLRQAKAFGILNDHDRSIGHIYPDFDDRSRHKYLRFILDKALHLRIFLRSLHLAVHLAHLVFGKSFAHVQISVFQVLDVHLLAFLNQGIDNVCLPALLELLTDKSV